MKKALLIETILIESFEIEAHYKIIKRLYLKVKSDGKIIISVPIETTRDYLLEFIKSNLDWIEIAQQELAELKESTIKLGKGETLLFGEPVRATYSADTLQELLHEKIMLYYDKYWSFFKESGFKPVEIKYRLMKRTWGICRPTACTITFNKRLVYQPVPFIEYVVLHEMCHLLIPNHSREFYALVASHMPHFREYENLRVTYDDL